MEEDITIRFRIEPAFKVTIVEDSTGKHWNGHYVLSRDAMEGLRIWRRALEKFHYSDRHLTFKAEDATLVNAVSWKTAILKDTNDSTT